MPGRRNTDFCLEDGCITVGMRGQLLGTPSTCLLAVLIHNSFWRIITSWLNPPHVHIMLDIEGNRRAKISPVDFVIYFSNLSVVWECCFIESRNNNQSNQENEGEGLELEGLCSRGRDLRGRV